MGKVTLKDLAKELGVSTTLVSRVLNAPRREDGSPDCDISRETAQKVLDLAKLRNYQPSRIAAGLDGTQNYKKIPCWDHSGRGHFIFRTKGQVNFSKRGQAPAVQRVTRAAFPPPLP